MPGHSNRPDLNVHSILTRLCAFSCSPIFFQNIHSQLYWMLPRRVFKKYWCSIQSPYLKLSCQNIPQSLVFCKSSIWDSFVHPALSTIVVKHHTNYTSRKPPGLSIYHPPNHKPYYTLLLTVWSISIQSLSLCPPKISNVPCETYAFIDCLFYIPYLFGSSSCKFHQNKTKQKCSWDRYVLVLQYFKKFLAPSNSRSPDLTTCHSFLALSFHIPWGFQ